MKKQLHLFYSGRVQGIGFRYAVLNIARQQKVSGWVKNLDDGRVEILAEASEDILKNFIQEINLKFSEYINDLNKEWLPIYQSALLKSKQAASKQNNEFNDFRIKF